MQSTGAKIAVAVVVIAAIVVAFVVAKGDDDKKKSDTTTAVTTGATGPTKKPVAKTKTIVLKDGKPVGGIVKLNFDKGETVKFAVKPDADGDIHIHGYNIEKPGTAGKTTKISFPATIDGVFEVEDHANDAQIAELTVNP